MGASTLMIFKASSIRESLIVLVAIAVASGFLVSQTKLLRVEELKTAWAFRMLRNPVCFHAIRVREALTAYDALILSDDIDGGISGEGHQWLKLLNERALNTVYLAVMF